VTWCVNEVTRPNMSGNICVCVCIASAALARLGMRCRLLSKVGSDANATFLLESLKHVMGVIVDDVISGCTDCVVTTTAFTYVIVCKESMSRTCIHTPLLFDITHDEVLQNIQQAEFHHDFSYVHFDSRHTESAVLFAEKIRTSNVFQNYEMTFSIDLEKPRPYIDNLICYCNIIFTNKKGIKNMFPTFIGES
jgi:sugar/nucleoside kinase (ribokinase family)